MSQDLKLLDDRDLFFANFDRNPNIDDFQIVIKDMENSIDTFYLSKVEPNKSCLLALRALIVGHDQKINETTKYGMPCFFLRKNHFVTFGLIKKRMNLTS